MEIWAGLTFRKMLACSDTWVLLSSRTAISTALHNCTNRAIVLHRCVHNFLLLVYLQELHCFEHHSVCFCWTKFGLTIPLLAELSFYFRSGSPLNFTILPLNTMDRLVSSMGQIESFYREETRRRLSSSNYYSGSASGLSGAGLVWSAPRTFCEWIYYFRRRRIYFSRGRASRCRTNGHETEQNLERERERAKERRAKDSPMNSRGNLELGSNSWTHPASGEEKVSKFLLYNHSPNIAPGISTQLFTGFSLIWCVCL